MRRAEGAENLIKEGKTKFRGEERVFKDGDLTVKVLVQDGVIVQVFAYPFDLKRDYLPVFEKMEKSGMFDDCVRGTYWILKAGLAMWQKFYGEHLKVLKEDSVFVLVDIDLEGFKKWFAKVV